MRIITNNGLVYDSADYSCYLEHHGIQGQKWGKQNGPPYPLSAGAHSATEKRLRGENEGKLESWKTSRTIASDARYDRAIRKGEKRIARYDKKINKAYERGNGKAVLKNVKRQQAAGTEVDRLKSMKGLEREAIAHMSMSDVRKENLKVAGSKAATALTLIGSITLSPTIYATFATPNHLVGVGIRPMFVHYRNKDDLRTKHRINSLIDKYKNGELEPNEKSYKAMKFMEDNVKSLKANGFSDGKISRMLMLDKSYVKSFSKGVKKLTSDEKKREHDRAVAENDRRREQTYRRAESMINSGMSVAEAARKLGVSPSTLYDLGLS